ncbi:MAG: HEAT repeat domain-containing protein [Desulfobacteraceae bacterium]|nr:HEAT repeat domain-containing protein [Desulfobacteraceae bacterium]
MKRLLFPAAVLAGGLALAQVLFTILVYVSNLELLAEMEALRASGYLVVPNEIVTRELDRITPAACGALFFTLTAGTGLTLAAFFAAWLKVRVFPKSRIYNAAVASTWLGAAAACNLQGWNPGFTIVFLLVPALVFTFTIKLIPGRQAGDVYVRAAHVIVVAIAALGWLPCLQQDVFLDIRDRVLLSNPAGQKVNEFYYNYTLYPAELIKPPAGRLISACAIKSKSAGTNAKDIAQKLIGFDLLPVSDPEGARLTVITDSSHLEFAMRGKVVFKTRANNFFSSPGETLEKFSQQADNKKYLRRFTLAGLTAAFPIGLYIFLHAGLCLVFWFIRSRPLRSAVASGCCLVVAVAFLLPFYGPQVKVSDKESIKMLLESTSWYDQRNALKAVAENNYDPLAFETGRKLAGSPRVPVRYWLARALGSSNRPEAKRMLLSMTNDCSPNVACMAYASLGGTGNGQTRKFILERIRRIDHWYVQQYAYKALRKLGWKQGLLNTD